MKKRPNNKGEKVSIHEVISTLYRLQICHVAPTHVWQHLRRWAFRFLREKTTNARRNAGTSEADEADDVDSEKAADDEEGGDGVEANNAGASEEDEADDVDSAKAADDEDAGDWVEADNTDADAEDAAEKLEKREMASETEDMKEAKSHAGTDPQEPSKERCSDVLLTPVS